MGDLVVEHFHAYGTRTGELLVAPPDGKTLTLRGIEIFRIVGDKGKPWAVLDGPAHVADLAEGRRVALHLASGTTVEATVDERG